MLRVKVKSHGLKAVSGDALKAISMGPASRPSLQEARSLSCPVLSLLARKPGGVV